MELRSAFLSHRLLAWGVLAGGLACAATLAHGALFSRLQDHSLCCGIGGPVGIEGVPLRSHQPFVSTSELPPPLPAAPVSGTPEEVDGYLKVGFDRLGSFEYAGPLTIESEKTAPPTAIPERIRQFDGKNVIVQGYMLPVRIERNRVTELLLMRDQQMCCYGIIPKVTDWVLVRTPAVALRMDQPLAFHGKLQVKEQYNNGYLAALYVLDAVKMTDARP